MRTRVSTTKRFLNYWSSPTARAAGIAVRVKSWEYQHLSLIRKYCKHEGLNKDEFSHCYHCRYAASR
jgi:hypothetical protein